MMIFKDLQVGDYFVFEHELRWANLLKEEKKKDEGLPYVGVFRKEDDDGKYSYKGILVDFRFGRNRGKFPSGKMGYTILAAEVRCINENNDPRKNMET